MLRGFPASIALCPLRCHGTAEGVEGPLEIHIRPRLYSHSQRSPHCLVARVVTKSGERKAHIRRLNSVSGYGEPIWES